MQYNMTRLEEYVKNLYFELGIYQPTDIDMMGIASAMNIWLHYRKSGSQLVCIDGMYSIILDESLSEEEQWQDFSHELGHALKHVGNQYKLNNLFKGLQEIQANNFMYHFCVPTFMLLEMEFARTRDLTIQKIAKEFGVTLNFAVKRFEMFERNVYAHEFSKQLEEIYRQEEEAHEIEEAKQLDALNPITLADVSFAPDEYVLINFYGQEFFITKKENEAFEKIKQMDGVHLHLSARNVELGFREFLNEFEDIERFYNLKENNFKG